MGGPVLIVSTGRCGSTLMSQIVRMHPDLLSLSEFFTSLSSRAFRGSELNGPAVFDRLNTLSPAGRAVVRNQLPMEEFLYRFGPAARYQPENLPAILCTTLPHLSDQPDELWDALGADLRLRPRAPLAEQYRFVFEWLTRRLGKTTWIERSGASLAFVPALARMFPDAKFVHVFRDGRDTAMSMQQHPFFRLRAEAATLLRMVGQDPFSPFNLPGTSPWMPWVEPIRFRLLNAKKFAQRQTDLAEVGRFWSDMILRGLRDLERLPEDRVLSLRYEDLTRSPRAELERFITFVGAEFRNEEWLAAAAALPRYRVPSWHRLPIEEQVRIKNICEPGQSALEQVGS